MYKPEKKRLFKPSTTKEDLEDPLHLFKEGESLGYNQACDDWNAWLPSIIEIKDILNTTCQECKQNKEGWCQYTCSILAKAISKRIKGEA